MKIKIRVKPFSNKRKIVESGENELVVYLNEKPVEGKGNNALIELLSEYFNVPKSAVIIVSGNKSRNKIVEILK